MKTLILILSLAFTSATALAQYGYKTAYGLAALSASGGMAPPPVAGYTMWLTTRDATTMFTNLAQTVQAVPGSSTGCRVAWWRDKSLVSNGTNSVFSLNQNNERPQLTNVAALNNLNAIRYIFTDNNNLLSSNTLLSTPASSSITVLVAGVMTASASAYASIFTWGGGAASEMRFRRNNLADQLELYHDPSDLVTGNFNTNQGYIFSFRINNTANTMEIWTNLLVFASGADTGNMPGSSKAGVGWMDNAPGAVYYWNGYIAEVLVYPSALSNTDMTNSINYLKTLYIP